MHFWINLNLQGYIIILLYCLFSSQKLCNFLCNSLTHELFRFLNISRAYFSSFQFYCTVVRDCGLRAIDSLILVENCFVPWLVYGHFVFHYVGNNMYPLTVGCRIPYPYLYLYTVFSSVSLIVLFVSFIFLIFSAA